MKREGRKGKESKGREEWEGGGTEGRDWPAHLFEPIAAYDPIPFQQLAASFPSCTLMSNNCEFL
jgi:hypothetical protein